MKKLACFFCMIVLLLGSSLYSQEKLEDIYMIEIKRLEETWNILDRYADEVWKGWKGYADVPFLFEYPNGVRLLVGYPHTPEGFEELQGITLRDKKVFIDRREEIPLKLEPPLTGGGGTRPFGDKRIETVHIKLRSHDKNDTASQEREDKLKLSSDGQILINLHELFHCHQREFYKPRYGNIRYNPDLNYALYSDIEGKALEKAYFEKDNERALKYLKDFIIARELKRETVDDNNSNCESQDDFMEGTAVYSEFQTLLMMKEGYTPVFSGKDDPYFYEFKDIDYFIHQKIESLKDSQGKTLDSRGKCYYYGCFQALLLTRLFPGWIDRFMRDQKFLDEIIASKLSIDDEGRENFMTRQKSEYDYDSIYNKHAPIIDERNKVIAEWKAQKGKTYVINFKKTKEYLNPEPRGKKYSAGLIELFPEGIKELIIQDVTLVSENTLIEKNQLYFIRWIDTQTPSAEKGYTVTYDKKKGENIYTNAEVKTKGFTLFAPEIEIRESKDRVKINVLSKIRSAITK
jgi:hypothetical protein